MGGEEIQSAAVKEAKYGNVSIDKHAQYTYQVIPSGEIEMYSISSSRHLNESKYFLVLLLYRVIQQDCQL